VNQAYKLIVGPGNEANVLILVHILLVVSGVHNYCTFQ
jgi:hypothetical protein